MGKGPRAIRSCGNLIEDQPAGLVDGNAALHQILGEAAVEIEASGQIVDAGYPLRSTSRALFAAASGSAVRLVAASDLADFGWVLVS